MRFLREDLHQCKKGEESENKVSDGAESTALNRTHYGRRHYCAHGAVVLNLPHLLLVTDCARFVADFSFIRFVTFPRGAVVHTRRLATGEAHRPLRR